MNTTANTTVEKFTSGPWEVDGFDLVSVIVNERPESNYPAWKHIVKCDYGYAVPEKHFEENKANAKLIAAAPDLFAACKEFVRKVEAGESRSTASYEQMKAAIKKATQ